MSDLKTYDCTVLFDASANVTVEASSPEEAADMAGDETSGHQHLCHHCANTLDTGDSIGVLVYEGDELVAETTLSAQMLSKAKSRIEADEALIEQALWALEHHQGQTRPINTTGAVITALRARLEQSNAS